MQNIILNKVSQIDKLHILPLHKIRKYGVFLRHPDIYGFISPINVDKNIDIIEEKNYTL